jgi:CubicO group peptidase (beta-lactamase class C family)
MLRAVTNAGIDPERCADLVAGARREIDDGPLPSCQLAIARHGCLLVFKTIDAGAPMSRYVTFSVTKALVAAAAWLLIGDGLLDPTAPVAGRRRAALGNGAGGLVETASAM